MANARQFNLEVDQFAKAIVDQSVEFLRKVAAEAFATIVQATPVGNNTRWAVNVKRAMKGLRPVPPGYVGGQARRNWRISLQAPNYTLRAGTDASVELAVHYTLRAGTDAIGQLAMQDGFGVLAGLRDLLPVWIVNPLPYMDALEHGWSKQAPTGMVANAVAAISAKYRRVT